MERRGAGGAAADRMKARKLVDRALALADADKCEAGLALLHRQRGQLPSVPPSYDAAIARLSLQAGRAADAIDYSTRAQLAGDGKLPAEARRTLADALLRSGRIEAAGRELGLLHDAGAKISGRVHLAAAEAFRRRAGEAVDSGPPTPWRVLAQAEILADMKDVVAAPTWLVVHRGAWDSIPDAYDAALCRLSLRCGDGEAAIALLTRACDEAAGVVPDVIRYSLAKALFNAGRLQDALHELSLTTDGGAAINRPDLRMALAHYRNEHGGGEAADTSFPKSLTLVDADRKLVYLSVPKNACSFLKATFVMNSAHRDAYLAGGGGIHQFCNKLTSAPLDREAIRGADYFRFVVLREPMRRTLSAYLDKFVRKRQMNSSSLRVQQMVHTIRHAQALAGVPYDLERSISFEEFVRFLAVADDAAFNAHWMPQWRSVGTDLSIYSHVGKVERLKETLELLDTRFGFVPEPLTKRHMPQVKRHAATFSETSSLKNPYRALPDELDEFEDGLPMPDAFFPPHVRELLQQRFAADVALYARA